MDNTIFIKHINEFITIRTGNIINTLKYTNEQCKSLYDRRSKLSSHLCNTYPEFLLYSDLDTSYISTITVEIYKQALFDLLTLQSTISWKV